MFLPSDCKSVLKIIKKSEPDLPNLFFSVEAILQKTNLSASDIFSVFNHLEKSGCIIWGDSQHTAFRLVEYGRAYDEFRYNEILHYFLDKWIEFLAIIISIIALIISIA